MDLLLGLKLVWLIVTLGFVIALALILVYRLLHYISEALESRNHKAHVERERLFESSRSQLELERLQHLYNKDDQFRDARQELFDKYEK